MPVPFESAISLIVSAALSALLIAAAITGPNDHE